jgi:hypothetical protein
MDAERPARNGTDIADVGQTDGDDGDAKWVRRLDLASIANDRVTGQDFDRVAPEIVPVLVLDTVALAFARIAAVPAPVVEIVPELAVMLTVSPKIAVPPAVTVPELLIVLVDATMPNIAPEITPTLVTVPEPTKPTPVTVAEMVPELVTVPESLKKAPVPPAPVAEMRPLLINSPGFEEMLRKSTPFVPPATEPALDMVALPPV